MANNRKAGRSNPDQNLDQATDMNQNLDKSTQSNDMNERSGGVEGVRGGQTQQSDAQNDSSLDADSSIDKGARR